MSELHIVYLSIVEGRLIDGHPLSLKQQSAHAAAYHAQYMDSSRIKFLNYQPLQRVTPIGVPTLRQAAVAEGKPCKAVSFNMDLISTANPLHRRAGTTG